MSRTHDPHDTVHMLHDSTVHLKPLGDKDDREINMIRSTSKSNMISSDYYATVITVTVINPIFGLGQE